MYKLFFLLFTCFLSAQQSCKLTFINSSLIDEGKIIFTIKNIGKKKIKTPVKYPENFANIIDIEVYNEHAKKYELSGYSFSMATCLKMKECFGKMTYLKREEIKEYKIQIISEKILNDVFKENKNYRFKLAFDTYLFSGCYDYVTDWLYYDNTN